MKTQTVIQEKPTDFEAYRLKVYNLLEGMKPGDKLLIEKITRSETREQFIEVVKEYMRDHEWQAGLSFGKGFSELRKYDLAFIIQNNKSKNVTL